MWLGISGSSATLHGPAGELYFSNLRSSDKFSALAEGVWASHDKHKKKYSPAETEARGDFKKIHGII